MKFYLCFSSCKKVNLPGSMKQVRSAQVPGLVEMVSGCTDGSVLTVTTGSLVLVVTCSITVLAAH